MNNSNALQPTQTKERIQSLDFLRGFAILGILIMNIQSFSMPGAAYSNPMAYGDLTGVNKWVWMISHIFADQKFMTIFSILFGAGVVLFTGNAEKKRGKSAGLHYRRMFWLLVIGLIHAYMIWHGDILVPYALCAFLMYLLRNVKPKTQVIVGIILLLIPSLFNVFTAMSIPYWPEEQVAEMKNTWQPGVERIDAEIAAFTGSFRQQITQRAGTAFFLETVVFLILFLWRVSGLMLIGMALYKWGVLSAQRSTAFYRKGFLISWLIGLPVVITGVVLNFRAGWTLEYSMFLGSQYNYIGSVLVSFGFICLVMIVAKSDAFTWIKDRLAAVGQMALTNYLTQSLMCTFIVYGFGLGFFGQVDRWGQILIVLMVWAIQILWSRPWLDRFYFGPMEWFWRTLTYWKFQPLRKR